MASSAIPTSFQLAKWRRVYENTDFSGKGYVSSDDGVIWGKKVADGIGMELDDESKAMWAKAFQAYYGDTKSYDEWVEYIAAFVKNVPNYMEVSENLNIEMFKVIDANKDGVVSIAEYKALVTAAFPDLSDEDVQYGFDMIDENGDGVLSQSEISIAWASYYFDGEESKYQHFYGKWNP